MPRTLSVHDGFPHTCDLIRVVELGPVMVDIVRYGAPHTLSTRGTSHKSDSRFASH